MAEDQSTIKTLLDKLPYADGTGRRRFVSGSLIVIALYVFYWADVPKDTKDSLGFQSLSELLKSPSTIVAVVLLIYSVGNIIELLTETYLMKAVAGFFAAIGNFLSAINGKPSLFDDAKSTTDRIVMALISVGLFVIAPVGGVIGLSPYRIRYAKAPLFSKNKFLITLPAEVADGLQWPFGPNNAIASHFLINSFKNSDDKVWAKKLVSRGKDISSITTSIVLVIAMALISGKWNPIPFYSQNQVNQDWLNAGELASEASLKHQELILLLEDSTLVPDGPGTNRVLELRLRNLVEAFAFPLTTDSSELWLDRAKVYLEETENLKFSPYWGHLKQSSLPDLDSINHRDYIFSKIDKIGPLVDGMYRELQKQKSIPIFYYLSLIVPFLLLYSGYFTYLKTSYYAIVNKLAIQEGHISPATKLRSLQEFKKEIVKK